MWFHWHWTMANFLKACMKLGYWQEAVKAAETAAQLCPEDHKAQNKTLEDGWRRPHVAVMCCIYLCNWYGMYDLSRSKQMYQPEAWFRLACALEGLGRLDEAQCFTKLAQGTSQYYSVLVCFSCLESKAKTDVSDFSMNLNVFVRCSLLFFNVFRLHY